MKDFWRVSSYGYPNPFNPDPKPQEAWTTFKSFCDRDQDSYNSLKAYWGSHKAPRKLNSHAVESWKAAFEEFGLLYVISNSNKITITPAGEQFHDAAEQKNEQEFVWIGINLLFRYPMQGPPRGQKKGTARADSDILPYRFLYSALRDLGDYFWWTELERILCQVFSTSAGRPAIDAVRQLRENPSKLEDYPLPVDEKQGVFYNSLNQVANHAGMNHLVLGKDNESEHYGPHESRRKHFIKRDYLSLVSVALGDPTSLTNCGISEKYVDRLPNAPALTDEQSYFDYLGAAVPSLKAVGATATPKSVTLGRDIVFILKSGEHFESVSQDHQNRVVQGKTLTLCRLARNHRVILSTDVNWTYLVVGKELAGPNTVRLILRRARPITNIDPIATLFGGNDA